MKRVHVSLVILHLFVGIGALFGGAAAILDPHTPLGMPAEALKYSPFRNYLVPGIILFTVIGIGNVASALMFRFKSKYQGYISGVFSGALVIWIVVQCIMLRAVVFLHVLYFVIGLVGAALSMMLLFEQDLFPANIVKKLYKIMAEKTDAKG